MKTVTIIGDFILESVFYDTIALRIRRRISVNCKVGEQSPAGRTLWNKNETEHWSNLKGLLEPHQHIFKYAKKYASKAETSLKLFQAVSMFCFSYTSELALPQVAKKGRRQMKTEKPAASIESPLWVICQRGGANGKKSHSRVKNIYETGGCRVPTQDKPAHINT